MDRVCMFCQENMHKIGVGHVTRKGDLNGGGSEKRP